MRETSALLRQAALHLGLMGCSKVCPSFPRAPGSIPSLGRQRSYTLPRKKKSSTVSFYRALVLIPGFFLFTLLGSRGISPLQPLQKLLPKQKKSDHVQRRTRTKDTNDQATWPTTPLQRQHPATQSLLSPASFSPKVISGPPDLGEHQVEILRGW